MNRPEYSQVDAEYRQAQLESRNQIIHKTSEADLWMRVVQRAIEDIALFKFLKEERDLTTEEENLLASAEGFIFDDKHFILMEDYKISLFCPRCTKQTVERISKIAGTGFSCEHCEHTVSWKCLKYTVYEEEPLQESSFAELMDIFGVDVPSFRKGVHKYVEKVVAKKKKERAKKTSNIYIEENKKQQLTFFFEIGDERW